MYKDKNIAAVILARMGSSRLPDKMLLPFGSSTVVETVIKRIKNSQLIDSYILATTTNSDDSVFEKIASQCSIPLFRGSEEDVVSRMLKAVEGLHPLPDIIVRVGADNPLVMPSIVDEAIVQLADVRADVITPFEFNTYPFGYSMVVMTRECLELIDRDATEKTYREHVENYCFEFPDRFRVLYQMAPEHLHYNELNLTLDYKVDYRRLQKCSNLLVDVPIEKQPFELVRSVREKKIAIILQNTQYIDLLSTALSKNYQKPLKLFCQAQRRPEERDIILLPKSAESNGVEVIYYNNVKELLPMIEEQAPALVISSIPLLEVGDSAELPEIVYVDSLDSKDGKRYCLKYHSDEGHQEEPLWVDTRDTVSLEAPEAFLCRVLPIFFKSLIAGPLRPAASIVHCFPPTEKRGSGERKGFSSAAAQVFPPMVLIELVEKLHYRDNSSTFYLDRCSMLKLLDEINYYSVERISLGYVNDPTEHPEYEWFSKELCSLKGKENVMSWSKGVFHDASVQEDAVFQQVVITPRGLIQYTGQPDTVIGDLVHCSIAEAWQSRRMQQARVKTLNALVLK